MKKKVFQEAKPSLRVASRKEEQTSIDSRLVEYNLVLPLSLQLVCKLVRISPEQILKDFMEVLAHQSISSRKAEKPQMLLVDYFIAMTHRQSNFTEDDMRQMFREAQAICDLWPSGAEKKFIDMHRKWQDEYVKYWMEKWQKKAF
ncbi:hypothetical protein [Pinibacter aurantiacus]|uniref:Uncharacterized protein n=1 Tax=Pinibacter aurantiacus TaxID=2851599 RepID=A0A9E2SD81_9BACT|nr:hypothetical protein [Pinibacter aurantiacus]MBV4358370.1 hypothetical protein [Pinibacter aurantiacus]